jgi:YbbR domain-containing protein
VRAVLRGLAHNAGLKFVSFGIALLAWLFVQSQQIATQRVRVDLELRTDPQLVNVEAPVGSVTAVLQGPLSALRRAQLLRPTLVVDLTDERAGKHEVPLEAWPVDGLPPSIKVLGFTPQSITVRLEPKTTRKVKVVPRSVGTPDSEHAVKAIVVTPDTVEVTGPKQMVVEVDAVDTRPIDVSGWSADGEVAVELELPKGVELAGGWSGTARVTLDATVVRMTFNEVRVLVPKHPGWAAAPRNETIQVVLEGPTRVLRSLRPDHIVAVVELPQNPTADSYTARFQADRAPRLDVLVPREDVVRVFEAPGPVEVVRR